MDLEYKTFPFEVKELTDLGVFEGYASTFGNVDSGGDVVERGAFGKTLKERGDKIRVCHQHDWRDVIGKPIELREDDRGLYVKAQLVLDVQRAREDYALMKAGALTDLSIGYEAVKADYAETDAGRVRRLKEVKLYEISPVTVAMNEAATITGVKEAEATPPIDEPATDDAPDLDAAAEPDDSPLTDAPETTIEPSAKLALYQLIRKYGG
ncbi:MAG: HK97 family phage prohead protease [bacterium]